MGNRWRWSVRDQVMTAGTTSVTTEHGSTRLAVALDRLARTQATLLFLYRSRAGSRRCLQSWSNLCRPRVCARQPGIRLLTKGLGLLVNHVLCRQIGRIWPRIHGAAPRPTVHGTTRYRWHRGKQFSNLGQPVQLGAHSLSVDHELGCAPVETTGIFISGLSPMGRGSGLDPRRNPAIPTCG